MNIDREFIKWFYEEHYPEQGSNRRQCYGMTAGTTNIDTIDFQVTQFNITTRQYILPGFFF